MQANQESTELYILYMSENAQRGSRVTDQEWMTKDESIERNGERRLSQLPGRWIKYSEEEDED